IGNKDGTAKVWEAAAGRELLALDCHTGAVVSVSWSPDGQRLATGSEEVWERVGDVDRRGEAMAGREKDGGKLVELEGHPGGVSSVCWSADGQRLATGGAEGTAKVWEAVGGRELFTLKAHTNWVRSVSWSPDGQRLATANDDETVKVWEVAGGRELI